MLLFTSRIKNILYWNSISSKNTNFLMKKTNANENCQILHEEQIVS